jgi:hypothetical protein
LVIPPIPGPFLLLEELSAPTGKPPSLEGIAYIIELVTLPGLEFREFLKTLTAIELALLIKDLRVHPDDKQHLKCALVELGTRDQK